MRRNKVAQIILGIGFGILLVGGSALDSVDMTRPIILCAIGLVLMLVSSPFLKGDNDEKNDFSDSGNDYSGNYPYDKTFRRR